MVMPHFNVHQPTSLREALNLVVRYQDNMKLLSGGTDLIPKLRVGIVKVENLISLNWLQELRSINYLDNDSLLVIGAGVRLREIAVHPDVCRYYPALSYACSVMANTQIRNMGTIGGNLVNAAPSADTAPPLLAYKAELVLVKRGGRRLVPLDKFFFGPGITQIDSSEVLEAIRVPTPINKSGSCYYRLSARSLVDIAAVSVAGCITLDVEDRILSLGLGLGSVASTPIYCSEIENMLIGRKITFSLITDIADMVVRIIKPIDDIRASAYYRRAIVNVLVRRVLIECLVRIKKDK